MSNNPNVTAQYVNIPSSLTSDWKKYVIQGATPNDTKLDFTQDQRGQVPRADLSTYDWAVWDKPNTDSLDYQTDLVFCQIKTPAFPLWVEKIKICLHQATTYGCVKVNVWDFGDSLSNDPTNLINVTAGQPSTKNCPVTLIENESLVSNALADTDLYMINSDQQCDLDPFDYTIAANSILRMGIQYAESNAYGLKVFLTGWTLECDVTEASS